jgi:hypothetical protein|eukprot:COSAG06_NODE_4692_length_4031_cov_4.370869_2_plen_151_part_00
MVSAIILPRQARDKHRENTIGRRTARLPPTCQAPCPSRPSPSPSSQHSSEVLVSSGESRQLMVLSGSRVTFAQFVTFVRRDADMPTSRGSAALSSICKKTHHHLFLSASPCLSRARLGGKDICGFFFLPSQPHTPGSPPPPPPGGNGTFF